MRGRSTGEAWLTPRLRREGGPCLARRCLHAAVAPGIWRSRCLGFGKHVQGRADRLSLAMFKAARMTSAEYCVAANAKHARATIAGGHGGHSGGSPGGRMRNTTAAGGVGASGCRGGTGGAEATRPYGATTAFPDTSLMAQTLANSCSTRSTSTQTMHNCVMSSEALHECLDGKPFTVPASEAIILHG